MLKLKRKWSSHGREFKSLRSFLEARTLHCRCKLSEPLVSEVCAREMRVKNVHWRRWHGIARTRKEISGGLDSPAPHPRAYDVKVKILVNKRLSLLYHIVVTLGNPWISWFFFLFLKSRFFYCCFNIVYKAKYCLESSTPNVYRGYKKISQQNWPFRGKENCSGRHIIA